MTLPRRLIHLAMLGAAVLTAGTVLLPLNASAQAAYPNRPIKLVVPFAPGGGSDVTARAVANKLSQRLGQPIVIDNKAGAGGSIGMAAVATAPADGYTLLFTTTALATNAATAAKLPFNPAKDFDGIGQIGTTSLLIVVATDFKAATLRDFVETARAKPGTIAYGSGGVGSMSHLAMEVVAAEAKIKLLHVPYKGMSPAFTDLAAGNVQAGLSSLASAKPFLGGKLRALAVTSAQRSPFMPDVPTASEAGIPGLQIDFWWGLLAPAGTPPAIVKQLNEALNWTLAQPDVRDTLAQDAAVPKPSTPEEFRKLVDLELVRWVKRVKDADIKAE